MGAYLSSPVTTKEVEEGNGSDVTYGYASMQGWRRTMEDAHLAEVKIGSKASSSGASPSSPTASDTSLFGVFDGHGGAEVAKFCQRYMVQELQKIPEFEEGAIDEALIKVFHVMDAMLRDGQYLSEIEQLKTKEAKDEEDGGEEGDGAGAMDALDLLKRVFQLKRFMGDGNGTGEGAAGSGAAAGAGAGPKAEEGPSDPEESMVQAGCTAVVAVKRGAHLYVANAGDSRGVLARAGKAVALSEDHKPASDTERSRIIAAGGFLSEIGGVCRVNGNLNLSRAIGDLRYKCNTELPPKDQIITAQPDIRKFTLTPEDRFFVLACDGVWDVMSNQDVVDFVSQRLDQGMSPVQISSALLDACLANDPKEARGVGCDNMTAILVVLQPQQGAQQPGQQQQQ